MKSKLLTAAVALCLLVAGGRIYKFYKEHTAPFKVGDCFVVHTQQMGDIEFKVVTQDEASKQYDIVGNVEVMPGIRMQLPMRVKYDDIRQETKSECSSNEKASN